MHATCVARATATRLKVRENEIRLQLFGGCDSASTPHLRDFCCTYFALLFLFFSKKNRNCQKQPSVARANNSTLVAQLRNSPRAH